MLRGRRGLGMMEDVRIRKLGLPIHARSLGIERVWWTSLDISKFYSTTCAVRTNQ